MRLTIDHRTQYRFSEPQARVVQLMRMSPFDYAAQTVIDWRIDVYCDARLREGHDGYGNITTMLYVDGPVDAVSIMVRGEVLTDDIAGLVKNTLEPLPPIFFTRTTPLTLADEALAALAGPGTASLERAIALNSVVNGAVSVEAGRTPKTRTAAVAVGLDAGDSTPLSVTRRGGGIEELDVGVRVAMS